MSVYPEGRDPHDRACGTDCVAEPWKAYETSRDDEHNDDDGLAASTKVTEANLLAYAALHCECLSHNSVTDPAGDRNLRQENR